MVQDSVYFSVSIYKIILNLKYIWLPHFLFPFPRLFFTFPKKEDEEAISSKD